jgi:hypothetical protein
MNLFDPNTEPQFSCTQCHKPNTCRVMGVFCSKECLTAWEDKRLPKCEVIGCHNPAKRMTVLGRNGYLCHVHQWQGHFVQEA